MFCRKSPQEAPRGFHICIKPNVLTGTIGASCKTLIDGLLYMYTFAL